MRVAITGRPYTTAVEAICDALATRPMLNDMRGTVRLTLDMEIGERGMFLWQMEAKPLLRQYGSTGVPDGYVQPDGEGGRVTDGMMKRALALFSESEQQREYNSRVIRMILDAALATRPEPVRGVPDGYVQLPQATLRELIGDEKFNALMALCVYPVGE